jgi:hypothetical protein
MTPINESPETQADFCMVLPVVILYKLKLFWTRVTPTDRCAFRSCGKWQKIISLNTLKQRERLKQAAQDFTVKVDARVTSR